MWHGLDDLPRVSTDEPDLHSLVGQFAATTDNRQFPCVFSALPFSTKEIYFALVPADEPPEQHVVRLLRELCARISREPDAIGVIFVPQPGEPTLDDDLGLARRLVHATMRANREDHPHADLPGPDHSDWILWLAGVGLFLNFSSPRHHARRSRNVGPMFTVIAQARESFDRQGRSGPRTRDEIRRRLGEYDEVPPHPCLGSYGDPDSRESLQFFLGDGTDPIDVAGVRP